MLLGDAPAAKELISRAVVAPDRIPGFAELPFFARGAGAVGTSYRMDLAVAYLALGDRASARQELNSVLTMLNAMIASGVERNGTYELRAKVYALEGQGDEAMRDLGRAVKLGWRRAWWAKHHVWPWSALPSLCVENLLHIRAALAASMPQCAVRTLAARLCGHQRHKILKYNEL